METRRSSRLRLKTRAEANNATEAKCDSELLVNEKHSVVKSRAKKVSSNGQTEAVPSSKENMKSKANSVSNSGETKSTSGRPRRSTTKKEVSYVYTKNDDSNGSSESSTPVSSDTDDIDTEQLQKNSNMIGKKRLTASTTSSDLQTKRRKQQELSSSSSSESGSDSDVDITNTSFPKNAQKNKIKRKVIKRKAGKCDADIGDVNWPKCRKASIARKTGNPAGSKVVKSGLRMAAKVKPEQPWKKNVAGYEADRQLARGERRMKEYRNIASAYALGKTNEVSYDECYKIHEKMKQAYREGRKLIEAVNGNSENIPQANDSSSEDEWEEMEQFHPAIEKNIEVTLEGDDEVEKDWWVIYLRQEVNKKIRETWENTHKMHLLCFMAHLKYVVKASLDEGLVPSLMASQLPHGFQKFFGCEIPPDVLQKLLYWFADTFRAERQEASVGNTNERIENDGRGARYPYTDRLSALIESKAFGTDLERATLLFCLLCGMEATTRLCVNAQVIPRKWNVTQHEAVNNQNKDSGKEREESSSTTKPKPKNPPTKKGGKLITKSEERNYWVEYWSRKEKRWICVDPLKKEVDHPLNIHIDAAHPISYVFAIDNSRGICEVSRRYAMDCVKQDFRRRRTDTKWLFETLGLPAFAANSQRKKWEQMQLWEDLIKRPLPTTMSEYKNHPLYVLEKDLLKFEAIYPAPETQKPLGQIRGHNVFPRSTVFTLQGENNWLKLARSIKIGEKPYKVVKARPDPRIPVEDRIDQFLDVYGFWQTEPYRRPPLKDGIIPRNEYGNVYMFNENMCPLDCVYLKLAGLVQISRKLNKQCVPAVVGWAFDGGWTHPVIDGAVVLKADADLFLKEWESLEHGKAEREENKRVERVYGNWKRLIKGILRLDYVKNQFGISSRIEKSDQSNHSNSSAVSALSLKPVIDHSVVSAPLEGFSLDDFISKKK